MHVALTSQEHLTIVSNPNHNASFSFSSVVHLLGGESGDWIN